MNLTRCNSGHYYDSDRYGSCPHCSAAGVPSPTPSQDITTAFGPDESETVALDESISNISSGVTQNLGVTNAIKDDDPKTISFTNQKMGIEPTVGWLVIMSGPNQGADFRLKSGRNFIGRSSSMDVALTEDKTVSREKHGIVVYDPKSYTYIIQPGTSKELCYRNDEVVLSPQKLELNDTITVGETTLIFVPLCTKEGFNWDKV